MSPVIALHEIVIWVEESTTALMPGAAVLVYMDTPEDAMESPAAVSEVQIIKVYCVPAVSPVMDLLVALAPAVVVESEVQVAGAAAPDLYAILYPFASPVILSQVRSIWTVDAAVAARFVVTGGFA